MIGSPPSYVWVDYSSPSQVFRQPSRPLMNESIMPLASNAEGRLSNDFLSLVSRRGGLSIGQTTLLVRNEILCSLVEKRPGRRSWGANPLETSQTCSPSLKHNCHPPNMFITFNHAHHYLNVQDHEVVLRRSCKSVFGMRAHKPFFTC